MVVLTTLTLFWLMLFWRTAVAAEEEPLLPRPATLEPAVQFWIRVFSEIETDEGFLHDDRYLDVVYEVVQLPAGASWRRQQEIIRDARARYRRVLAQLATGAADDDPQAERLRSQWQASADPDALAGAADRVRFQRGQADRFRQGLSRAGAWREYIRRTLTSSGVPEALTALPHVESSFDPTAYSHADAAGLWQFTPSTGRRFMQIDHVVDERLDPYLSTHAAAQLLRYNQAVTGSWPLAITAYNHGAAGVQRAVEQLGTRDIGEIAWRYRGRAFGFASRNFYAAFLAALDVEARADSLFGAVAVEAPPELQVATLPDYVSVRTLASALGVDAPLLRALNPAVLDPVWTGRKHWPRGFPLRVPASAAPTGLESALAVIPPSARHDRQVPDRYHRIDPGESLSQIAALHRTSVDTLMRLNDLASPHRIRAGARLRLPGAGMPVPPVRPSVILRSGLADASGARRGDAVLALGDRRPDAPQPTPTTHVDAGSR